VVVRVSFPQHDALYIAFFGEVHAFEDVLLILGC
jgi:hypothetical protein